MKNETVRLLIVEDEPIIAKDLAYALEDLGYAVAGICRHHSEALAALESSSIDLILCDIHLDGDDWDGIQLAEEIRKRHAVPIIFLTGLSDTSHIARAAAVEPEAYLVKPFEKRGLRAAIELAVSKFSRQQNLMPSAVENEEPLPFIAGNFFIKDKKRLIKTPAADILFVRAEGVYSQISTVSGRQFLVSAHLGAIEDRLQGLPFVRVHRSFLVNFEHIDAIEEDLISIGVDRIPLGKSYRESFYKRLQTL